MQAGRAIGGNVKACRGRRGPGDAHARREAGEQGGESVEVRG